MKLKQRINYYRRVYSAYVTKKISHLSFWHGEPEVNEKLRSKCLGEYYMRFTGKADYSVVSDSEGIPLLNYHGAVGIQYNPIAIAQYGLGNFNLYKRTEDPERRTRFLLASNWLVDNIEQNEHGLFVWNHHFDWDYRALLKAPWYSALAQGQGLSLLVRANLESGESKYMQAAEKAFEPFLHDLEDGGVTYTDEDGYLWFEEYIIYHLPPTHVLNGFIWAIWGIWDFWLATKDSLVEDLFNSSIYTLENNLYRFDIGYWSLYDLSDTALYMIASPFYHKLHLIQLEVLYKLTGNSVFDSYREEWKNYASNPINRIRAMGYKALFKLLYY